MKIAFLGLGIMGSRMAKRLANAGLDITVWNRSQEVLDEFWDANISAKTDIIEAVENVDVVITMLSTPQVIEELAFGEKGFVSTLKKGSIWINTTTIDPESSQSFGQKSIEYNIDYIDAPVAGTKQPAENGELVFLLGGDKSVIDSASHIFEILGKKNIHLGEVGKGSAMKLLVNMMLAHSMTAFAETISIGKELGLDELLMHKVLTNTPVVAPFISVISDKLLSSETSPNFPLKWMLKDIHLAQNSSLVKTPLTDKIEELFSEANKAGFSDQDFSSVYQLFNPIKSE